MSVVKATSPPINCSFAKRVRHAIPDGLFLMTPNKSSRCSFWNFRMRISLTINARVVGLAGGRTAWDPDLAFRPYTHFLFWRASIKSITILIISIRETHALEMYLLSVRSAGVWTMLRLRGKLTCFYREICSRRLFDSHWRTNTSCQYTLEYRTMAL